MKKTLALVTTLGMSFSAPIFASTLDVDINNDALRAQYNVSDKGADVGLSASLLLTDDNGEVAAITWRTQGVLANQQMVRGGFGVRGYAANPDAGDSFQSLGIGGYVDVVVPEMQDLTLGVEIFYAPSITTTDDLDNVKELQLRATYQLFDNAAAYLGLRHLEVEAGNTDFEIEEGLHLGFTLQF